MSVHIKKNGTYVVRYRFHGIQAQKSFGKGEQGRLDAEAFNASILHKGSKKRHRFLNLQSDTVDYFDELVHKFYAQQGDSDEKKWTTDWKKMLNKHLLHDLGQIPLKELTQEYIVGLVAEKFPKAKPVTRGRYISYLSAVFNYGVKMRHLKENPLRYVKIKQSKQKSFTLTLDTILRLRDIAPPHLAFAIEIMVNTGVRPGKSELLSLQWQHVLWSQNKIRVFATKTQKWRTIPLRVEFMEKLRQQKELAKTAYLVEYEGKQVGAIHQSFRTACNTIGESKSTVLYDIRHWYCSTLLSNRMPVNTVSKLMGHSSPMMTLTKYAHVIPGDTEQSLEHIPAIV